MVTVRQRIIYFHDYFIIVLVPKPKRQNSIQPCFFNSLHSNQSNGIELKPTMAFYFKLQLINYKGPMDLGKYGKTGDQLKFWIL